MTTTHHPPALDATPTLAEALATYSPAYLDRYRTLQATFAPLAHYLTGKQVLDFGCGKGLSAAVLVECGAAKVTGVDVFADMMEGGEDALRATGYADRITLRWLMDTRALPFRPRSFDAVVCNAVFEHIPQPRDEYVRAAWGMVAPGGVLIINETPNKYLPVDFHTLHLPLTNWLPSRLAHWIGVQTGRFSARRTDWAYSGWRGAGHYELLRPIPKHERRIIPDMATARHRGLHRLRLPSGLVDPYPLWIIQRTI